MKRVGKSFFLAAERTSSKGPWLTRGWCVPEQREAVVAGVAGGGAWLV